MNKAVALKYDNNLPAPFIAGKGKDFTADRLIKIAEEHNIPVIKDNLLSETLYFMEPGEYIPQEVYEVVAEILVFIKNVQELV